MVPLLPSGDGGCGETQSMTSLARTTGYNLDEETLTPDWTLDGRELL